MNTAGFFRALVLGGAALLGALGAQAQSTFRDDFNTSSWGENTGTDDFTAAWSRSSNPNTSRTGTHGQLRDGASITRAANLAAFDIATLNLRVRSVGLLENSDTLTIRVRPNPSTGWTNVRSFADDIVGSVDVTAVITGVMSATTEVQVLVGGTNDTGEFFEVDFVEIRARRPTCFTDNFESAALNAADWATSSVSGTFGQPGIVGGRLRLTDSSGSVSTAASLRRFLPGADNRVVVEFNYLAYGGSGADGVAVTLSDGAVTPVAGGFGGSLGYAQRDGINGFAGGWLGVGLDEFGNFSNPSEGRILGPGARADAVALRGSGSGTTGYPFLRGTSTLRPGVDASGSAPAPNHRYRITIDNREQVTTGARVMVERDTTGTGSSFTTIIPAFDILAENPGQAPVPANFRLSLTGSTGGATNIHELDNLRVCATRLEQPVEVDHFRFEHDGQGLTCEPESIVVRACLDPACTQQVSGPIGVTLSPGGWVGGDTQTITSGQTLRLRRPTPGTATLAITQSTPPRRPFASDRCFVGGVERSNCNLDFANAGFVHEVSNHVSAVEQTVTLRAVRLDEPTQRCVPSFASVTLSVGFWQAYVNPTTGMRDIQVASGATTITLGETAPGTALDLPFNANGEATIRVRYDDAGAMTLLSRYTGSAANSDTGLVMEGSDGFIAKPRDFLLAVTGSGPGGATTATGPIFARAGAPFAVTVTARNNAGVATPNFGRELAPEGVILESTLQAPAGGLNPDPVADPGFGAFSSGVATGNWRWDEVGIITLTPRLADRDYLGYGTPAQPAPGNSPDVIGTALQNVGRFIPARLGVVPNTPVLANACAAGSFGYVGQEFGFATAPSLLVSGLNARGSVTGNYVNAGAAGNFWRFGGALANRSYTNTAAGTRVLTRTTNGGAGALSENSAAPFDGTGRVTVNGDRLTYAKPVDEEAPFTAQMTLALTAADLTDSDGVCFDAAPLGSCDPLNLTGITGSQQRWGRIAVTNAFGPELTDLQVPMSAEFFDGTGFVTNAADVCTGLTLLPIADPNPGDSLVPAETCVQDTGAPGASLQGCTTAGPALRRYTLVPPTGSGGRYTLWLRAPGAGNVGVLDVTPNVPAWLQFNWRGAGPVAPTARVGFGVFQGDRRAIHRREVY